MAKHFAVGDSEGPDVANLQLNFWRLAVQKFDEIRGKWDTHVLVPGEVDDAEYTENEFVVDAATAIVLAGTSVSELAGQNVEPRGNQTPDLRPALRTLLGAAIPAKMEGFIKIYDDLRHFGQAKYDAVASISEQDLCEYLLAAQEIWVAVLRRLGRPVDNDFSHRFEFPE